MTKEYFERIVDSLERENRDLKKTNADKKREIGQLEVELKALEDSTDECRENVSHLEFRLDKKEREADRLKDELQEVRSAFNDCGIFEDYEGYRFSFNSELDRQLFMEVIDCIHESDVLSVYYSIKNLHHAIINKEIPYVQR